MIKLNKNQKYWAEIDVTNDGQIKIVRASKLTQLNQYKSTWKQIPARNVARGLNNSEIVIK